MRIEPRRKVLVRPCQAETREEPIDVVYVDCYDIKKRGTDQLPAKRPWFVIIGWFFSNEDKIQRIWQGDVCSV